MCHRFIHHMLSYSLSRRMQTSAVVAKRMKAAEESFRRLLYLIPKKGTTNDLRVGMQLT